MYECIIIGTGPAGISAALTLKNMSIDFLLIGPKELSKKINTKHEIKNYPGLFNITGDNFKKKLIEQLNFCNINIENDLVSGIYKNKESYTVITNNSMFETRTVILALGVDSLNSIDGEVELLGNGISYCTVCDAFLYKNKEIMVLIYDKSYNEEIEYLKKYTDKIKVVSIDNSYNGEFFYSNIKPIKFSKIDKKINVLFKDEEILCDGVFILNDSKAIHSLIKDIEISDMHVRALKTKTNLSGVFAAGDITGKPYQYAKAIGEGNVAAFMVKKFLTKNHI